MLRSTFNSWREYLTPAYHTSTFSQTGEITPEEFVQAGDYLTYKFPTWQWLGAPASKQRDFLPTDKQVLVTRRVPSLVRANDYENVAIEEEEDADGWTTTSGPHTGATSGTKQAGAQQSEIEEIDDLIDNTAEDDDDDEQEYTTQANKRFYDLYIHYSTAYRVPRMYLVGFDSNGTPLTPEQMFEDISEDYRDKTVTIEKAPFLNDTTTVSIHPCRHAAVMKVLINRAMSAARLKKEKQDLLKGVKNIGLADSEDTDDWEQLDDTSVDDVQSVVRVDQYLIIFLKFITSVTPGIEHDYTMDAF